MFGGCGCFNHLNPLSSEFAKSSSSIIDSRLLQCKVKGGSIGLEKGAKNV